MVKKDTNKYLLIVIIFIIIFFIAFVSFKSATSNENNKPNDNSLLSFEISDLNNSALKKLDLKDMYDYNIFYYGVTDVKLHYNNKIYDLETALKEKIISMEEIIEKSEKAAKENKIKSDEYLDGGSKIYRYENITIIKCNKDLTNNKDVYIGNKNMNLGNINDLNSTLSDDDSWLND